MLTALARFCYRQRWVVLLTWIALMVGINLGSSALGSGFSQEFSLAGSDSQAAMDLMGPQARSATGDVVFKADAGITDPAVKARLETLFAELRRTQGVKGVITPFDPIPQAASMVAPDGRIGFATLLLGEEFPIPQATSAAVEAAVQATRGSGLQIDLGGAFGQTGPSSSEAFGLVAALFILLIVFGSLLAAGLPLLTAMFGLGVGMAAVGIISHLVSVPEFSTQLAAMIGIGVGIDYALFIVTRYRQGLTEGLEPEAAVVRAIDTAGRAVLFAGTTVVISLAGMLLMGIKFVSGLGLASAAVVLVTMLTSITLLPAMLGFVGRKIDALALPGSNKHARSTREGFWFGWSRFLQAHPWPFAVAGLAVLMLMAIPVFSLRLGTADNSSLPTTSTVRRAYDLKVEGFGAGANTAVLLVARLPAGGSAEALRPVTEAVAATPNVQFASPFFTLPGDNPQVATALVRPKTSGQDEATQRLIVDLRSRVLPAAAPAGYELHVGGETAMFDDMAAKLQERLPVFIGVVLGLSFLLLLVVFRSVLVPVKAVLMNVLSIAAAYGVVVAVFQMGIGASLIGVGNSGPIESFLPMMMFAILFGLSMDYEVFLLSRIKEEYDAGGDNSLAVANGLSATARVITAAALIMMTVFGAFMFGEQRVIKEFGLGLSVAILIDASIVRMVLVPATMELLGKANWWFPSWLSWLPTVHVEGNPDEDIDTEMAALVEAERAPKA